MNKLLATAAIAAGLMVAGSASAAVNLIHNGDFETPIANPASPGFDTQYSYRDGTSNSSGNPAHSMYDEGTWTIGTNPHDVHDLWINQQFSNMLILNGKTTGTPTTAWSQDIQVAGGLYDYAFDVVNLYGGPGASNIRFDFSSNGSDFVTLNNVLTQQDGSDAGVIWHRSGQFSTGAGTLRISLRNDMGEAGGNDFGIDNISVSSAGVPEPASWALMLVGFGGLGSMLRANRRRTAAAVAA